MSTFLNAQRKGFVKGAGTVYCCQICKRNTRPTGTGDNDGVKLCVECYDLAGEENALSDDGKFYETPQFVLKTIEAIRKKGGDASKWAKLEVKAKELIA